MSPVLRIDDEVWDWLKQQARPFEDTPNSVLRRVAGIDPPLSNSARAPEAASRTAREPTRQSVADSIGNPPAPSHAQPRIGRRVTGEGLNRAYQLGARHALYHKDGTFFEQLTSFPGVLCDPNGYVRFESESQFRSDSRLSIGEKVNIPRGLNSHPRYSKFPKGS